MQRLWAKRVVVLLLLVPGASAFAGILLQPWSVRTASRPVLRAASGAGSLSMTNVKGVARNEDIMNVVQLAKQAMPNRPDGVVVCVQYSSVRCMLLLFAAPGSGDAGETDGGADGVKTRRRKT
jgi:hypothetical protein